MCPTLSPSLFSKCLEFSVLSKMRLNNQDNSFAPSYHDIVKYGKDPRNLANAPTLEDFLHSYGKILDNVLTILAKGGYYALVIGDKYAEGEWIPLGFYTLGETLKRGLKLKAICIKNIEETLAKRKQIHLWKYRVLKVRCNPLWLFG
jgi:hypothetical protein